MSKDCDISICAHPPGRKPVRQDNIYDVWLICYKEENRWALAYLIRPRAVSFGYCLFLYLVEKICTLGLSPVSNRPAFQENDRSEMLIINSDIRGMVRENGNKH